MFTFVLGTDIGGMEVILFIFSVVRKRRSVMIGKGDEGSEVWEAMYCSHCV